MKIDKLSDGQKTVMLAKAMGMTPDVMNSGVLCVDLYDPANMALAWRVLNWAIENLPKFMRTIEENFLCIGVLPYFGITPETAQRAWLDRILSLAIEAGMVADDE